MQKFWDSAMDIGPDDDSDNRRLVSLSQIGIFGQYLLLPDLVYLECCNYTIKTPDSPTFASDNKRKVKKKANNRW